MSALTEAVRKAAVADGAKPTEVDIFVEAVGLVERFVAAVEKIADAAHRP